MSIASLDPYRLCDLQSNLRARQASSAKRHHIVMLNRIKSQFGSKRSTSRVLNQNTFYEDSRQHADIITDAPPAYSPAPALVHHDVNTRTDSPQTSQVDDRYAFLTSFDTIFLIDDSGSMAGGRWRETGQALEAITPICTAYDADGIDIYFLNHPDQSFCHNITSASTVREVFQTVKPGGGTPTGQRLSQILRPYLSRLESRPNDTKPINIICITDGEPSDDVESALIAAAKKLDKLEAPAWQIGVQFFQVGRDETATKHLQQLDDELAETAGDDDLRDIVDTVPFLGTEGAQLTGEGILKVVLGAVNRRLDRKKGGNLHR